MAGKSSNQVTLFSNGIGHFRRLVNVKAGTNENISIPFKRDHIADVLESLTVFGNVRLASPPSFTPTNSDSTSLSIDPKNATRSLLANLSGSVIHIVDMNQETHTDCVLIGFETENIDEGLSIDVLTVLKNGKVLRFPVGDVEFEFADQDVLVEINKSLKNNYQRIKPESTFLDLSLASLDTDGVAHDETAIIQYKIPVAAWKMRYSVRQENGRFFLEGTAIVDNNTDENWNDFLISVVTGNPVTFYSPDMAAVTIPHRQTLNVVDSNAVGVVRESMSSGGSRYNKLSAAKALARGYSMSASFSSSSAEMLEDNEEYDEDDHDIEMAAASPGVDSKEIGDFCIFTSKEPISIASKRSAIVPMFTVPLLSASSLLYYKEETHSRRPFRTIKFKNETNYSLGTGKVVVYCDGVFSGESILDAAKPGENRLISHCLENGVKIVKTPLDKEVSVTGLNLKNGTGYMEKTSRAHTEYVITNKKPESFVLIMEHKNVLHGKSWEKCSGAEVKNVEEIQDGVRFQVDLKPNETLTIKVSERSMDCENAQLVGNYNWIWHNIIRPNTPLRDNPLVISCLAIQEDLNTIDSQMNNLNKDILDLEKDSDRIRLNIKSTNLGSDSEEAKSIISKWIFELDQIDNKIRQHRQNDLKDLERKKNLLLQEMDETIKKIEASWNSGS